MVLLESILRSFCDGLLRKDSLKNSKRTKDLVCWVEFLGLEFNEGMLLIDGSPLKGFEVAKSEAVSEGMPELFMC